MFEKIYSPESVGLHSDGIADFIEEIVSARLCTHGLAVVRFGKPVFESYEKHFSPDKVHRMYSVSKTFVSAAIGTLIDEGRLSLSDKVASFFPERVPANLHPYIAAATVRDLLMMATPFNGTTYGVQDSDWVKTFFTAEPSHMPGTVFNYDTSASLVLDAIVERITGKPFMDYLYEKVLKYIGFAEGRRCVKSPEGFSWGGSGVLCTLRELAAFAQLFLDNGRAHDGRQLISEEYITAAVSKQISNEVDNAFSSYGTYGYGYQVWRTEDGYAFLGMGNQLAIIYPEKQLFFVCISDDQGNSAAREILLRSFKKNVVEKITSDCLPENANAKSRLDSLCGSFKMPVPEGSAFSPLAQRINGKVFELNKNPMRISDIRFDFEGDCGKMTYTTPRGVKTLTFGMGYFDDGVFPETHYFGDTIGTPLGRGYECHTAAAWQSEDKLIIRCYITDDYLGNLTASVSFKSGAPDLLMTKTAEWFLDEYKGFAGAKR